MYILCTQWVTLSVVFFLVNYQGSFLQVVTLGGLVLGALIVGLVVTLADELGRHLSYFTGRALVLAAAFLGLEGICAFLPGYQLEQSWRAWVFILGYAVFAICIGNILRKRRK